MWNCKLVLLSLFIFNSPVLMWCQNNFIIIPGGKFTPLKNWEFASDAEQITYTVNQFQLSKYETTNEDFVRFLNAVIDRKSTRLNSSHVKISYAAFCLKKKTLTQ